MMRSLGLSALLGLAGLLACARPAGAVDSSANAPASPPPSSADNRLIVSGNGETLTGTNGGEGGSVNLLHSQTGWVVGAGGEYQKLANANWEFGSLAGALIGSLDSVKWSLGAEAHLGAGDIANNEVLVPGSSYEGEPRVRDSGIDRSSSSSSADPSVSDHHFNYDVEAVNVSGTFLDRLTLQLESRQYDIDTTHGNLPKVGLGVLWAREWLTTASYAHSVSGNLGTEFVTLRIDHYGRVLNWVVGGARGHVAPPVINIQTGATGVAPLYSEGYAGITRVFPRFELALLGDYIDLSGSKRVTATLTITVHLANGGAR